MKVFLTHASEDEKVATEICLALRGAGHDVFFDADDLPPGGDYNTRIRDAIDASDALVFLVSPHSVDAGSYTLSELKFAKQRWPKPWGHVLPVMVSETVLGEVDPYLTAVTVLKPSGNRAAEVVDALARLPDSAEAKAVSARVRSPLFALQASLVGAMVVAWMLLALAFGIDAPVVQQSAGLAVGVVAASAILVATVGGVRRARDASLRTLGQAYRSVLSQPWFAVISSLLAAGATALFGWQLATLNRVSFIAPQDVELIQSDRPREGRSLGALKAGERTDIVLEVGTRSIAYREVNGPADELSVLGPIVVPRLWSGTGRSVVTIPKLDRFGTLREKGGTGSPAPMADASLAQKVNMKWGLENEWSYSELAQGRADDEDLATRRPKSTARRYRTFAFAEGKAEVREPWLACLNGLERLWDKYRRSAPTPGAGAAAEDARDQFRAYLAREDPKCVGQFKRTAPRLYFDFTTDTARQFVLERVEVTTLGFSEYRGGGFAEKEAWYDILLSHRKGLKPYFPEPRLVFKEHGRVTLRLWSDNFYPNVGWMAPMGEYTIDIHFVFSTAGKTVAVSTGPFKIDV